MTCFCDIHLNKLIPHMNFYGYYGIGLNKEWGVRKGIQPIHYINAASYLRKDFSEVFSYALSLNEKENKEIFNKHNDYLLTDLLYMKPLNGMMLRDGKYELRNFHDEKEWRYVPNLSKVTTDLPLLIPQEQLNPKAYSTYTAGLRQCREFWLHLEYENIKYIIVKSTKDRDEIITFIMEMLEAKNIDKLTLVSKVIVFDELKEDW